MGVLTKLRYIFDTASERTQRYMEANRAGGSSANPAVNRGTPTNVFRYKQRHSLNAIFKPKSIAVIGATEKAGSVGRTLLWNLISSLL
jgi:hypothetical protein